jgi:hypothetical protein
VIQRERERGREGGREGERERERERETEITMSSWMVGRSGKTSEAC